MLHVESESHLKDYVDHDLTALETILYIKAVDPVGYATHHLCGAFYCTVCDTELYKADKLTTLVQAMYTWRNWRNR